MKLKKVILAIASCFCALSCAVGFGIIQAKAAEPIYDNPNIQEFYILNEKFTVPAIQVEIEGERHPLNSKVVFPDGSAYDAHSFVLTNTGIYTIVYSCEVDGKLYQTEKSFEVKARSQDLFTLKNATVKFGKSDYCEELVGAQFDGSVGMEVVYDNVVDLSDGTKEDLFLELVATAHTPKSSDFTRFIITLTDVHDSSNIVYIKTQCATSNSYYRTYMQAKTFEQRYVGLDNGYPHFGYDYGGTVLGHSFGSWYDTPELNAEQTIKLYWDNSDLALYTISYTGAKVKVSDFNDESYQEKLWGGFTTGEVKVKIALDGVSGSPRFVVKNINGISFASEYPQDNVAPKVQVELPENELPKAQVGKKFTLFDATVKDNLALKEVVTKVYYDYSAGGYVECSINDGAFVPNREGEYAIVYIAEDTFGNKTQEVVTVYAYKTLPELIVEFSDKSNEVRQKGEMFELRDYTIDGGSGGYKATFSLRKDGEEREISKMQISLMEIGQYEIVCKAVDYIGNVTETAYPLTIEEQTKLFLDSEIQLPKALISGQKFLLPIMEAYDYTGNTPVAVRPTISATIGGKAVDVAEDGTILPVATVDGEILTVKYTYNSGTLSNEYTKEIPVVIAKDSDGLAIEKYFTLEGFSSKALLDSIQFIASESKATTTFVKPVQAKSFSLEFFVDETLSNVSYIDFIFTDRIYKDISIQIRMNANGTMSLMGEKGKSVYFTEKAQKKTFAINYNNDKKTFSDLGGTAFGVAMTTLNDKEFTGFISNEIYLTIQMGTVKEDVNLFISKLNGQVISRATRDNIAPQIFLDSEIGGSQSLNDTVTIYESNAYDVLGYIKSFTVSVIHKETNTPLVSNDGITLQDVDASRRYQVSLKEFGQYQIIVTATDSNNKKAEASKNMFVSDTEPPKIKTDKSIVTQGKVNESISLPAMSVTDNYTAKDKIITYIVVVDPNESGKIYQSAFTPTMKGTYYVRYIAIDENGQIAMIEFSVQVG